MNYNFPKEEVLGSEFIFNHVNRVEINWTCGLDFEPKLLDCTLSNRVLDVYALCLKNGFLPDETSLIYYNNSSNSDNSITGDYNIDCYRDPGFDQMFSLNPNKIDIKYDEIIFFIGRPQTRNNKNKNWIDHELVKEVKDEICYVNCMIQCGREYLEIKNIKYEYNKFGATVLFRFLKNNESWNLDLKHYIYNNGLIEIIEKHLKHRTNNV